MTAKIKHRIIYDGNCRLCKSSVGFVESFDRKKKFSFIPFQTNETHAKESTGETNVSVPDSVILDMNGKKYKKSTAILNIFREMGFPWNLLYVLIIIPKFLRDPVYNFVAKRRGRISYE